MARRVPNNETSEDREIRLADLRAKKARWMQSERGKATTNAWRENNRDRIYMNNINLKFGVSKQLYDLYLYEQDNKCAICGGPPAGGRGKGRRFSVDHDHKTSKVRGLLCSNCNSGLGYFKDSPSTLRKAINYLATGGPTLGLRKQVKEILDKMRSVIDADADGES